MINPLAFIALAAVPLYYWADRRVGSGGANVLGPLGGRGAGFLAGGLVGAVLGYVAAGPAGAVLGPFWVLYRSLDFKRGALAPTNDKESVNAVLRHAPAMLVAVPILFLNGPWVTALVAMAAYAHVASLIAFDLGDRLVACNRDGGAWNDEWNNEAERIRGTAYGVAFAAICLKGAIW